MFFPNFSKFAIYFTQQKFISKASDTKDTQWQ